MNRFGSVVDEEMVWTAENGLSSKSETNPQWRNHEQQIYFQLSVNGAFKAFDLIVVRGERRRT